MEDLLQDIEQWIREGSSISVQFQLLTIDGSCDVGISSFTETECTASTGSAAVGLIVGAVAGIGVVLILVIIVVVVITMALHRKRHATLNIDDSELKDSK